MELIIIIMLLFASAALITYSFSNKKLVEEAHLPAEIKGRSSNGGLKGFNFSQVLSLPAQLAESIITRANIPMDNLKKKLASANNPMSAAQFIALKLLTVVSLPFAAAVIFRLQPALIILCAGIGFILPDFWLKNQIKKRRSAILRDLPHVIDLLNICVGAGLDFMVAVNWVIEEFRPCPLVEEMKGMTREIQMGSSRKEALRHLSARINSPEVSSFVRTLLQADRIGTPISEALKMQSEEIRMRWFQRGEEMALKAPIKLLFPLLVFILPVVLIIVAGPILIQFTRGGMLKF